MITLSPSASLNVKHILYTTSTFGHHQFIIKKALMSTNHPRHHYDMLKVDTNASTKDIKESFLRLSKLYHPDNKETGSHAKFVKLKEAYDAIKDGPYYSNSTTSSPYNCDPDISNRYNEAYYRKQYHRYGPNYKPYNSGFGGPFANQDDPWKSYENARAKQSIPTMPFRPILHFTLFVSALAWVVIYSGVLLLWDYNDELRHAAKNYSQDDLKSYMAYRETLKAHKNERLLKSRLRRGVNEQPDKPVTVDEAPANISIDDQKIVTTVGIK